MTLVNDFINYIKQEHLFSKNDLLLLAVSGGADSVALSELCHRAGFSFVIVHCNFQLRGEESERDEAFVKDLAAHYGVDLFVKKFDTARYAGEKKISIQVAARELRYGWFYELLEEKKVADKDRGIYIVTAHHANDNIETLLMNFFKGTGIKGLQGIQPRYGSLVRPLLFARKETLLQFLKEAQIDFVEDSSNLSVKYTRNYFRNEIIPLIRKTFPQVEENLMHNISRFHDIEILYRQSIWLHKKKLLVYKGEELHIPVLKLMKSEPAETIFYEIIKDYGFTPHQLQEAVALWKSDSGKYISSSTHRIIRNRSWLLITPLHTLHAAHILIEERETSVPFELGELKLKHEKPAAGKIDTSLHIAMLDAKHITFPLLLRKWKQGDYFYPLGAPGKKKLSKFFIDQKMSLTEKEKTWVLESNKRIIWVIGKRIDDRFKITARTQNILSVSLNA